MAEFGIPLSVEIDEFLNNTENEKMGGVYLAKPTGKFLDEDNTYLEVLIGNKSFYAKPCMSFGSWNVPSKKWLDKYKDRIMVWVAFEHGNPAHAVYLGINPLDEKIPELPYKNGKHYTSTKYRYSVDDDSDKFLFERFTDKGVSHKVVIDNKTTEIKVGSMGIKITDNIITLGDGIGGQSVIMGEKFVSKLTELLSAIMTDTLVVSGLSASHSIPLKARVSSVATELSQSLSKKVKIE